MQDIFIFKLFGNRFYCLINILNASATIPTQTHGYDSPRNLASVQYFAVDKKNRPRNLGGFWLLF